MNRVKRIIILVTIGIFASGCSLFTATSPNISKQELTLKSGTIILSHRLPERGLPEQKSLLKFSAKQPSKMAPLIGFFPNILAYVPAGNEVWLEVETETSKVTLYKGDDAVTEFLATGIKQLSSKDLNKGSFIVEQKHEKPRWYAPDEYFSKRGLSVPDITSPSRFRRGALGDYTLVLSSKTLNSTAESVTQRQFQIHAAPIWTEEVGGIKLDKRELATIFQKLPIGAPVIVK